MFDANLRHGVQNCQAIFVKPYNLDDQLREMGMVTSEVYLAIKLTKHTLRVLVDDVWWFLEDHERTGAMLVFEGRGDLQGFIDKDSLQQAKELLGAT